ETTKGDVAAARAELHGVLGRNPLRGSSMVMLADIAAAGNDIEAAKGELRKALVHYPHADALHQSAALLGIPDELEQLRVDGLDAVTEYQRSGKSYPGVSEVLVLDRSAARVYANGGQRQIVHLVVHLLSKAAIDRYGELQFPDGARLLTLRTIKPDGALLEAESVAGKDGLSLRDLAIGDFVEQEFVIEREPATALPGYVDVSTFRFQSLEIPYHRSELLVVHPEGLAIREDRRKNPPEAVLGKLVQDGTKLVTRLYRARQVERLGDEPGHGALLDELPNVRVYTAIDVPSYLDGLAVQIRHGGRSNVELRRLVRKLVAGKKDPRARLQVLWSWVVENVEDGGDLGASATATLAARAGSRLMLLRAMLREAGVSAELWLARDRFGAAPLPGGHPMLEEYDAAMLAVELPGSKDPLMVLTASKVMPLGYLSPGYETTDGLRVHLDPGDGPSGVVKLPSAREGLLDRRSWALTVDLDDKGAAKVAGKITLQGGEAIAWRQALREVDRDRIREVFQQAELGWLRGASLGELEILEEKQLDRPLVLTFTAKAPDYAIQQGEALMLRANPLMLSTAARMSTLPTRKTGMVIPFAPDLRVDVTLRVHGTVLRELPQPVKLESPFGRYDRKLSSGGVGKDEARLELRSTLRPGLVTAVEYPAFVEFAREVESAEQALVKAAR
ncbi:MAG: transglutaminase domain-containing protein, partial [Deltaproteobacteria bacterium]|nr:transglutaminase domain-containing protein [Nannocystaceae bacterium]